MIFFCWWFFYTLFVIYLEFFWGGYDFFVPGLFLCLQYRQKWFVGLLIVWIVLHESVSRLVFGSVLLTYLGIMLFFFIGSWFFEKRHFVFILSLSLLSAIWQWFVYRIFAGMQEIYLQLNFYTIGMQCFISLVGWFLLSAVYRKIVYGTD